VVILTLVEPSQRSQAIPSPDELGQLEVAVGKDGLGTMKGPWGGDARRGGRGHHKSVKSVWLGCPRWSRASFV